MKKETRDSVKDSLLGIEEKLGRSVGAGKLHEHEALSDEEFRQLVHTLTQDVIVEFEEAKKRAYEEGFQAGLKAAGEARPMVVTQAPQPEEEFERIERDLLQKID